MFAYLFVFETNSQERGILVWSMEGTRVEQRECMLPVFFEDCQIANMESDCL